MKKGFLFVVVCVGFLMTCFLFGYLGFRPGEFAFKKWVLVSANIASGSFPGLMYSVNSGDIASGIFWFPALAILLASLWCYIRDGNYVLFFIGLEIWAAVGFFRVIAESM